MECVARAALAGDLPTPRTFPDLQAPARSPYLGAPGARRFFSDKRSAMRTQALIHLANRGRER